MKKYLGGLLLLFGVAVMNLGTPQMCHGIYGQECSMIKYVAYVLVGLPFVLIGSKIMEKQ